LSLFATVLLCNVCVVGTLGFRCAHRYGFRPVRYGYIIFRCPIRFFAEGPRSSPAFVVSSRLLAKQRHSVSPAEIGRRLISPEKLSISGIPSLLRMKNHITASGNISGVCCAGYLRYFVCVLEMRRKLEDAGVNWPLEVPSVKRKTFPATAFSHLTEGEVGELLSSLTTCCLRHFPRKELQEMYRGDLSGSHSLLQQLMTQTFKLVIGEI
jgi:Transcription factor AP-2